MNMDQSQPQFNFPIAAASAAPLTMSSREIAEVVDSRHDKVKQSIERLVQRGVISQPPMGDVVTMQQQPNGGVKEVKVAVYHVSKRDSYVVVAQLSPEFTARLVDRWQELEERAAKPALPDFSDPVVAARAWADALERKQAAETRMIEAQRLVADLAPKAEAYDRLDALEGALSIRPAAKVLGIQENRLIKWLQLNRWAFRQGGKGPLQAYVEKINTGYLDHKLGEYMDGHGEKRVSITLMITPKGMKRIAHLLTKGEAA
jgi:phage antirepressor YoqD-like protein